MVIVPEGLLKVRLFLIEAAATVASVPVPVITKEAVPLTSVLPLTLIPPPTFTLNPPLIVLAVAPLRVSDPDIFKSDARV